ncbi:MAG: mechanosensitive ion channel family protein [Bacillota bacterium]
MDIKGLLRELRDLPDNLKEVLGDMYSPSVVIIKVIGIIVLTMIIARAGSFIVKKAFEKQKSFKYKIDNKRLDTLSTLFVSMFRYSIYILSGVSILTILTDALNLRSLLAAAGIGGIALGFGAQSLIKDIISGAFIVFEDQYRVGDRVTVESLTGVVEELQLRVTKLRNFNGDLHIIPNGEIKKVTNHSRGGKAVIVDIPLAYKVDINKAFEIADRVCKEVPGEFNTILEEPKVLGITDLGKDSLNLRIIARTVPDEHWEVERRIRKLIKEAYDKENIEFFDRYRVLMDDREGGSRSGQ